MLEEDKMIELEIPTDSFSVRLETEEHSQRLVLSPLKMVLEKANAIILSNNRID